MRILVFGRPLITQKIINALHEEDISVTSIPDGFAEWIELIDPKEMTLAILDCCANQIDSAYRYINNSGFVPIAFIMNDKMENWKKISRLNAVGFFPEEAGIKELKARLRAILRQSFIHKHV